MAVTFTLEDNDIADMRKAVAAHHIRHPNQQQPGLIPAIEIKPLAGGIGAGQLDNPEAVMIALFERILQRIDGQSQGHYKPQEVGPQPGGPAFTHPRNAPAPAAGAAAPAQPTETYDAAMNNLTDALSSGNTISKKELDAVQKNAATIVASLESQGEKRLNDSEKEILKLARELKDPDVALDKVKGLVDGILKADKVDQGQKPIEKAADGQTITNKTEAVPLSELTKEKGKLTALDQYGETLNKLVDQKIITGQEREELVNRATHMKTEDVGKMNSATLALEDAYKKNRDLDEKRVGMNDDDKKLFKGADDKQLHDALMTKRKPDELDTVTKTINAGTDKAQAEIKGVADKATAEKATAVAAAREAGAKSAAPTAQERATLDLAKAQNKVLDKYKEELKLSGIPEKDQAGLVEKRQNELNDIKTLDGLKPVEAAQDTRNAKLKEVRKEVEAYAKTLVDGGALKEEGVQKFTDRVMKNATDMKTEELDAAKQGVHAKNEVKKEQFGKIKDAQALSAKQHEVAEGLANKNGITHDPSAANSINANANFHDKNDIAAKVKEAMKDVGNINFGRKHVEVDMTTIGLQAAPTAPGNGQTLAPKGKPGP